MIKKIILALAIALPSFAFAQKFAVVDVQSIIVSMPQYKEVTDKLEKSNASLQTEFENLQKEFATKQTEFQQLAEDTPASIKARREQDLQESYEKIQRFVQQAQQEMDRQEAEEMQKLGTIVTDAVKAVGAEGGYTFVFQNLQPVYTGTDVTDITETVKKKLGIK